MKIKIKTEKTTISINCEDRDTKREILKKIDKSKVLMVKLSLKGKVTIENYDQTRIAIYVDKGNPLEIKKIVKKFLITNFPQLTILDIKNLPDESC